MIQAAGQQHAEQPEFNNEGKVDQDVEHHQVKSPLLDPSLDNKTTEFSNQSLESENICLKKTVAQFQKVFSRMKARYIALELKCQNQSSKSGQHGQFSKVKSKEAKVKHDIDVIETINIELEHSVAKLLTENEHLNKEKEHLKKTYKDLYDSIKKTRVQPYKTRNSNKPIEQKSHTQKRVRQIITGHRFSSNKSSAVYEKMSPRSCLRWKPTGIIFKIVGLRWVPMRNIFASFIRKVDSETQHGSNTDITNLHECIQNLDSGAGTSINVQEEQTLDLSAGTPFNLKKERIKALIKKFVSKSSAVTTADGSDKHQQQPDSTSSTSTLATTVTADGNSDL
ncbi:hypothetical protein Tco_0825069 [Tanacetum coccineum]